MAAPAISSCEACQTETRCATPHSPTLARSLLFLLRACACGCPEVEPTRLPSFAFAFSLFSHGVISIGWSRFDRAQPGDVRQGLAASASRVMVICMAWQGVARRGEAWHPQETAQKLALSLSV
jgi:hypothetical protein